MTAVRVVRCHTAARVSPGGGERRTGLVLRAESGAPGEWRLTADPPDDSGADPAERARTAWRLLREKARPVLSGHGLLVEAGRTRTEVLCDGRTVLSRSRGYLLVRDGDHVLHLDDAPASAVALPWVRAVEADEIRPEDAVLLGPSALLALTAAVTEERGGAAPDGAAVPDRSPPSPYPPHDLSLSDLPELLDLPGPPDLSDLADPPPEATTGRSRCDLEQACELLGDPALWLVPHGTFGEFAAGDLPETAAARLPAAVPPPRALVIDSLTPQSRSAGGTLHWTAAYRVSDSTGAGRGTGPLRLRGAPAELLAAAGARCGPSRPGLGRDPIGRPLYRLAPTVSTALHAGRVLAL
ncbi:hypothetical protein [Streptomyces sp. TS71-3]|uniref:hypothetical protein n=1 Tax=Streptomyces sp. TS71-3 TaxID=2733862 RepID=UPI001BB33410|nr:hypothetical protein [Streptomyces sp. TS71-3]